MLYLQNTCYFGQGKSFRSGKSQEILLAQTCGNPECEFNLCCVYSCLVLDLLLYMESLSYAGSDLISGYTGSRQ